MWNSKPAAVEDLFDLYVHRPCAYILLVCLLSLPSKLQPTPNLITLGSLILGWLGAVLVIEGMVGPLFPICVSGMIGLSGNNFWIIHLGSFSMFMSMVFDCADGQLARATGTGSQWGRFIDGVADILVVIAYCVALAVVLLYQYGVIGFTLGIIASLAIQQACNFYDKTKTAYTIVTKGPDHAELVATVDRNGLRKDLARAVVDPKVTWQDQFLINFAIWYAEGLNLDSELKILEADPTPVDPKQRRATMRFCSFFGSGATAFFLYVTVFCCAYYPQSFLIYSLIQTFGGNGLRYWAWKNSIRDKILAQKEFFPLKMTIPCIGIGVVVYVVCLYAIPQKP